MRHRDLGVEAQEKALEGNAERKNELEALLEAIGMSVEWGRLGGGTVVTSQGGKAPFPLKAATLSRDFDRQLGAFYYRWLCTFTHASPSTRYSPESSGAPSMPMAPGQAYRLA